MVVDVVFAAGAPDVLDALALGSSGVADAASLAATGAFGFLGRFGFFGFASLALVPAAIAAARGSASGNAATFVEAIGAGVALGVALAADPTTPTPAVGAFVGASPVATVFAAEARAFAARVRSTMKTAATATIPRSSGMMIRAGLRGFTIDESSGPGSSGGSDGLDCAVSDIPLWCACAS